MNLDTLNSLTKYPSIPTYHTIDKGKLSGDAITFDPSDCIVTEKVDGTNARVILFGDKDWIIGSREELLHAKGDRIWNPSQGIVEAVRDIAAEYTRDPRHDIIVVYGEVYGYKIGGASKQYTASDATWFRLFDVASIPIDNLRWNVVQAAEWRENGGQFFFPYEERGPVTVPIFNAEPPPSGIRETYEWLQRFRQSHCTLDSAAGGRSEGVVIRTRDRSRIVKLRFEDYERTLRAAK